MTAAELAEQLELMTYGVGAQTPDGTFPLPDKMPTFAPAALLRQAAARLRAIEEALTTICGCFEAAAAEGWFDALAEGEIERIRDLWQRRIGIAYEYAMDATLSDEERTAPAETTAITNEQKQKPKSAGA